MPVFLAAKRTTVMFWPFTCRNGSYCFTCVSDVEMERLNCCCAAGYKFLYVNQYKLESSKRILSESDEIHSIKNENSLNPLDLFRAETPFPKHLTQPSPPSHQQRYKPTHSKNLRSAGVALVLAYKKHLTQPGPPPHQQRYKPTDSKNLRNACVALVLA
jgi:hypothetical protein